MNLQESLAVVKRGFVVVLCWMNISFGQSGIMVVSEKPENGMITLCHENQIPVYHFIDLESAVYAAKKNQGIMLLHSGEGPAVFSKRLVKTIRKKDLRIFVEFQKQIPGLQFRDTVLLLNKERAIVHSEEMRGLSKMDVLSVNEKEMLLLEDNDLLLDRALLLMGKVAGYDTAEYGFEGTDIYPLLFSHDQNFLVSTVKLSNAIDGRFGPSLQWKEVFSNIFSWVSQKEISLKSWHPSVSPMYMKNDTLDERALFKSIKYGIQWYYNAKLFVDESWAHLYEQNTSKNGKLVVHPPVADSVVVGNGQFGILEGHASRINPDGSQPYRWWIRADCQAETAYALSSAALFYKDEKYVETAKNLLNYLFEKSNLRSQERNDPTSPSFGLIGWATTDPDAYYGDDNARALLGVIGASTNLEISDWDEKLIEGILGNYRTAGVNGFRGPWFRDKQMQQTSWQDLGNRSITNIHPHYESWLWALYLWLYDKTSYEPFLTKAKKAISITMEAYPNWKWTNGIQQEYARMILPLAWLVRVDDTEQHRQWLDTVVSTLLREIDNSGAIPERLGEKGYGRYEKIASNAEYGTKEAPLISSEENKVSDLLYTMNFAFFSLNEAAKATDISSYKEAVSKIAEFMIRVQVSSSIHKDLHGAWFRAFDYDKWEYWASNADSDWGPWGTLTGWTQSWIINTLINQYSNQSLWDSSSKRYKNEEFKTQAFSKIESMLINNNQ